jgi:hypothetical protein
MTRKLCVAGCSFSDYTYVDNVYGDFLSRLLNFDYLHEGAGCGSNWRIWRKITGHVLNKTLVPGDIIVIQYTNPERREFYSKNVPYANPHLDPKNGVKICEAYDDGSIIRYKYGSHEWQDYENDAKFLLEYENAHINSVYDLECFNSQHAMFQEFMKNHNMTVVFINGRYATMNDQTLDIIDVFKPYVFDESLDFIHSEEYALSPGDVGHMNEAGHKKFSEMLYEHFKTINII